MIYLYTSPYFRCMWPKKKSIGFSFPRNKAHHAPCPGHAEASANYESRHLRQPLHGAESKLLAVVSTINHH